MFIAALFTIARTWKQPGCLSTDEWIKKVWYTYTTKYYSAIKRSAFESVLMRWMNIEPVIQVLHSVHSVIQSEQSEVNQKGKDKYCTLNTNIWNLEKWYPRIYLQGSNGETDIENRLMDMGRGEERVWKVLLHGNLHHHM